MANKRIYVVIGFNVVEMRWVPMYRCETLKRARELYAPIAAAVAAFLDLVAIECDIEDVETIETVCAALPPVALFEVFEAYADVAERAFTLGGGKWFRVPPGAAAPKKGGTVH